MGKHFLSLRSFPILSLLLFALVCHGEGTSKEDYSVAQGNRESQIIFWEKEIRGFREGTLSRAYGDLYAAQRALESAKSRQGWLFTNTDDKANIKLLDEDFRRKMAEVAVLQRQEQMMLDRVKPLYGIVSRHFAKEQRDVIVSSVKKVQEMSYDNAWYSSLFNSGNAESFTDLIVSFFVQWLVGYVLMYPFAAAYYAFWQAPWSIYAYSSGPSDLLLAVAAWLVSVVVVLLPILALIGGYFYLHRVYGDRIEQAIRAARERERR